MVAARQHWCALHLGSLNRHPATPSSTLARGIRERANPSNGVTRAYPHRRSCTAMLGAAGVRIAAIEETA
jgi:hypothetical protein